MTRLKILLQSTLFYPSVGGIETVSQCLANNYTTLGHSCTVITRSVSDSPDSFSFNVARNPTFKEIWQLIKSCDLVHCNGASLELVFWAKLLGKPIVWTHAGYQLISIDGLGWHEGEPSPLSVWPSFLFHAKKQGAKRAFIELIKLLIRRFAAKFIHHVAITQWVAKRQPFENQIVIYNPFPIQRFAKSVGKKNEDYDFFFLGRLVSEKGVETLIKAFAIFLIENQGYYKKLLIIGDGNWRSKLEALTLQLQINNQVDFVGKQTGEKLLEYVSKGKIAIIPSQWEEPMGGVALELLAADKPVIVSQNGGLAECVGEAGLIFENGDEKALSKQMSLLYKNEELQNSLRANSKIQLTKFNEKELTLQYIDFFKSILRQ